MPRPVVVTGPPGAGKSTVAARLVQTFPVAALVPGDAFFAFWAQGFVEPWRPEAREQNETVLRAAGAAVGGYARGGCRVVYEGVLGPWLLPAFLAGAGLPSVHYLVLLPPVDVCLARVAQRSGHGFTDPDAVRHMHDEFTGVSLDARHVLRDGGADVIGTTAEIAARIGAGTALLHAARLPPASP